MFKLIRKLIDKILQLLSGWHTRHAGSDMFLYVSGVCIGLGAGAGAALLKWGVDAVTHLIFNSFHVKSGNWIILLFPIAGIMLATFFTRLVIKQPMDHASDRIADGMAHGNNRLRPRMILGPIVGCSLTLGMGGSAGAEDPIAYTGAAIGSNVGQAFKVDNDRLAELVGCGAAAGIAGIFMAPIGGVMFALEVLKMKQSLQSVLTVVFSSLTAALTCFILMGAHFDVTFVPSLLFDNHLIPWVLLCGVFCGLYSAYYSRMMSVCRHQFKHISNPWLKAAIGGLMMSAFLFIFPSLYGEGYHIIGKLMIDDPLSTVSYSPLYKFGLDYPVLMILMGALLLVKPLATSATNDSGGIGGDFTPTFFCGGIAGFLFASVLNHLLGLHLPLALFAFFGMAAVMSGAVMAPLMAIFICAEMTGLYGFILPLTLSSIASVLTSLIVGRIKLKPLPFLHREPLKITPIPGTPDSTISGTTNSTISGTTHSTISDTADIGSHTEENPD